MNLRSGNLREVDDALELAQDFEALSRVHLGVRTTDVASEPTREGHLARAVRLQRVVRAGTKEVAMVTPCSLLVLAILGFLCIAAQVVMSARAIGTE